MRRAPAAWIALAFAMLGCSESALTQIVVVVDSDAKGFERLVIDVDGFEKPVSIEAVLDGKPMPRRVALVHEGGPLGPIGVTVSGFVAGSTKALLSEPRTGLFFERGKTLLLKVDLLAECVGHCSAKQACVAGPTCVASDAASELVPWKGDIDKLQVTDTVRAGTTRPPNSIGDAGDDADAADSGRAPETGDADISTPDAGDGLDAGPPWTGPTFSYDASNFDPTMVIRRESDLVDVALDCGAASFDSTALVFTNFCEAEPLAVIVEQSNGGDAVVLVMREFTIAKGVTLALTGSRPVVFAAFGDVSIAGTIDASAHGALPGPGADRVCASGGAGEAGGNAVGTIGATGGGGGGFGSRGGDGGISAGSAGMPKAGGAMTGNSMILPLEGGCSGGRGGAGPSGLLAAPGAGGGGVQISALGTLLVSGAVLAGGGGGGIGVSAYHSGAGGGSGGTILLEAAHINMSQDAIVAANGGAGGGGRPTSLVASATSMQGEDGNAGTDPALGGMGSGSAGDGGAGAALGVEARPGQDGAWYGRAGDGMSGGGGGGGGGSGRVRVVSEHECTVQGTISPLPTLVCPG
jgi:hypothetical protein